ncbi:hypothetical protein DD238_008239 [Peronospora effusa]|uniref:Uncharacterized protein n=1 Tax=Peronospora effusa TaxID=542832 RepID=A0A3M6VDB2_9STRA|nr:hypothetical protein DD238_008239 [Peronospora effusa]RQM11245.1 hypothetical protein DD237_008270 [Peronospora effusa]
MKATPRPAWSVLWPVSTKLRLNSLRIVSASFLTTNYTEVRFIFLSASPLSACYARSVHVPIPETLRPISLMGVDEKALSKVLTNRLPLFLPYLPMLIRRHLSKDAYDRVDWGYMFQVLAYMSCGVIFFDWETLLYTN